MTCPTLSAICLLAASSCFLSPTDAVAQPCPPDTVVPLGPILQPGALAPLAKMVGRRHLVGVGESEHGGREFHEIAYRLAGELAHEGPVVLALEVDQAHTLRFDRYVRGLEPDLEALFAERWWGSDFHYDRALHDLLVRARELNQLHPDRLRVAGFDLKQPDLALGEISREMGSDDPIGANELRILAREILAIGFYGVLPDTAGFTADRAVVLDAADREPSTHPGSDRRVVRIAVPLTADFAVYGEAGINLHAAGAAWSEGAVASVALSELGRAPRELAVDLRLDPTDSALELTVWHRGNGTVRFGRPRLTVASGEIYPLEWSGLIPRPLPMPVVQARDYVFHLETSPGTAGDLVVRATPAFERASAAADRVVSLVNAYVAAHAGGPATEARLWLPQLARLVQQAVAWRTLREPNRDVFLAANVKWLANEAFPDHQVVVFAHSGHTNRLPGRSMGFWLAEGAPDYLTVVLLARDGSHRYWSGSDIQAFHPGDEIPLHPIESSVWVRALAPLAPGALPAVFDLRRGRQCLPVPAELWGPPGPEDGRHGRRDTADLMVVIERLEPSEPISSSHPRLASGRDVGLVSETP